VCSVDRSEGHAVAHGQSPLAWSLAHRQPAQQARPRRRRFSSPYGSQSPGLPGPGSGPSIGNPDQMSSRPQERSARAPADWYSRPPLGVIVSRTSPGRTVIEVRTRPRGERASTVHGRNGSSPMGITPAAPGGNTPSTFPFTTSVTSMVVPLPISRLCVGGDMGGSTVGVQPSKNANAKRTRICEAYRTPRVVSLHR
jgi:hypothetical protein